MSCFALRPLLLAAGIGLLALSAPVLRAAEVDGSQFEGSLQLAALSPEEREQMRDQIRQQWQNRSPEERQRIREQARERWEQMNPEQRQQLRERWQDRGQERGGQRDAAPSGRPEGRPEGGRRGWRDGRG